MNYIARVVSILGITTNYFIKNMYSYCYSPELLLQERQDGAYGSLHCTGLQGNGDTLFSVNVRPLYYLPLHPNKTTRKDKLFPPPNTMKKDEQCIYYYSATSQMRKDKTTNADGQTSTTISLELSHQ